MPVTVEIREEIREYEITLVAYIDGREAGSLSCNTPDEDTPADILVTNLVCEPHALRKGVASALMRAFEDQHAGAIIDHRERTPDGVAWAMSFYGHNARYTLDGARHDSVDCELRDPLT